MRGTNDAAAEYDRFLGPIAAMLEHRSSVDELTGCLGQARVEEMGLGLNPALDRLVATKILAWHQAATSRAGSR